MNTNIRTKNVQLTQSMKNHLEASLSQLEKFNFNIHHIDVIVNDNVKKNSNKFEVEYLIKVDYQKDLIVLNNHDEDFHACVDVLTEKSEKKLRRLHLKKVDKKTTFKEDFYSQIEELEREAV